METTAGLIEFKFERTIAAPAATLYDAWLDPKIPRTPWNKAEKVIMNTQTDGLFGFEVMAGYPHAHYGRFVVLERPARIQVTWMSPNTLGRESAVTVTFQERGNGTLMTLVHSGLPDAECGRDHEDGWNYFLDLFAEQFSAT